MSNNKIKLQVLFLTYGDKYKESFDILNIYLKELEEYCDINIMTIHNDYMSGGFNFYPDGGVIGDNTAYEFSGWSQGMLYLAEDKTDYDVCLFINDSFLVNDYYRNKKLLSIETIRGCLSENALVGGVDRLDWNLDFRNHKYEINGKDVKAWIRTNLFYMTKEMIDSLDSMVSITKGDLNKFISQEYHGRAFLHNADISINLQLQMIAYFTKHWHSKRDINAENWETWRFKVHAMCMEKLLYVKVKELGFNIYDYSEFHYEGCENAK